MTANLLKQFLRGRAAAAYQAHNLEVGSSNLPLATKSLCPSLCGDRRNCAREFYTGLLFRHYTNYIHADIIDNTEAYCYAA